MFAVYHAPSSMFVLGWGQLLVLALLAVAIAAVANKRSRTISVGLIVASILGFSAASAMAVPYHYCDPVWRYFGWC